jgi:hypothetical protein
MSQRSVEQVIGRLATDEEFRLRFQTDRKSTLEEMSAGGHPLTAIERLALTELDLAACERFAGCLDSRIQKISLRTGEPCPSPAASASESEPSGMPRSPGN